MAKNWVEWFRERRSAIGHSFKRADLPFVHISDPMSVKEVLSGGIGIAIVVGLVTWLGLSAFHVKQAGDTALTLAKYVLFGFWMLPFVMMLFSSLRRLERPDWQVWRIYPTAQRWVACAALVFILTAVVDELYYPTKQWVEKQMAAYSDTKPVKPHKSKNLPKHLLTPSEFIVYCWPIGTVSLYVLMVWVSRRKPDKPKPFKPKKVKNDLPFSLWIGESTGYLASLWHPASVARGQQVGLTVEDAAQNILILGAIGSGKTTRAMHPLLVQLLDQDTGGLMFDIKGDFKKAVFTCAELTSRTVTVIGVGQQPLNLLAGLTPEMAASFLKSALLLGGGSKLDSFWTDTATELCRNVLGLLSFLPEHYHLNGLYRYLFDTQYQETIHNLIQVNVLFKDSDQRRLEAYQHYLKVIFAQFDEKVRTGVLASVSQILSSFQHPDLVDTFCATGDNAYRMEDVLERTLYLVDMPLSVWGIAGKVVYTLIKLRFFNVMQQRAIHHEWNQTRPAFFMCDEYQEIVSCNKDGLSDLNFWDKSRSSKTIGIISAQSVSSFYAAIGDRDLTHALLQNFRQKLIFRVEDDWTISYCNRLLGQVETQRIVEGSSSGSSSGVHGNNHESYSQTINYQQKDVIDGQLFRNMGADQALALLSIYGYAADDVLNVAPVYV